MATLPLIHSVAQTNTENLQNDTVTNKHIVSSKANVPCKSKTKRLCTNCNGQLNKCWFDQKLENTKGLTLTFWNEVCWLHTRDG